ncbi:hypothetical protein ACOSP7_029062 [Xanthoceras sorbifolium]
MDHSRGNIILKLMLKQTEVLILGMVKLKKINFKGSKQVTVVLYADNSIVARWLQGIMFMFLGS